MLVPGDPRKGNCPTCKALVGKTCKQAMPCQARIDKAPLVEIPDNWEVVRNEIREKRRRKGSSRGRPSDPIIHKVLGWIWLDDDIL